MPQPLPVPALDHVVINTRDRLGEAAEHYRRLGFTLTPMGRHTLGSVNHLAVLASDYLELIGIDPEAATPRADLMRFPIGLDGLVFATDAADEIRSALLAQGIAAGEVVEFSRPVAVPEGTRDARFRVVRLAPEAVAYARVYFCQHLTRGLIWRDEWRHHANGAIGMMRTVIASADPDATAGLYRRMFGPEAVRPTGSGFSLAIGLSRFDILDKGTAATAFPGSAGDTRAEYAAALTLRTRDLAQTQRALAGIDGVMADRQRVVVPPTAAFGASLEFRE